MEIQLFPLGPIPAVVQRLVHTTYNCGIPFRLGTAGPYDLMAKLVNALVLETNTERFADSNSAEVTIYTKRKVIL